MTEGAAFLVIMGLGFVLILLAIHAGDDDRHGKGHTHQHNDKGR